MITVQGRRQRHRGGEWRSSAEQHQGLETTVLPTRLDLNLGLLHKPSNG
jgi:hypothetical protein